MLHVALIDCPEDRVIPGVEHFDTHPFAETQEWGLGGAQIERFDGAPLRDARRTRAAGSVRYRTGSDDGAGPQPARIRRMLDQPVEVERHLLAVGMSEPLAAALNLQGQLNPSVHPRTPQFVGSDCDRREAGGWLGLNPPEAGLHFA